MSLMKKAYDTIKAKIVSCEYAPDSFLNELSLMKEIGVSRTPIREAMSKLEHENLVRIVPKKGVIVSGLSLGDVKEVYQVREVLEPFIIRNWGSKVDLAILEDYHNRLSRTSEKTPDDEYILLDTELHKMIYDNCENKYFVQLMNKVYDQNHRIRIISGKSHRRLEDSRQEHLGIVNCLLQGDTEGAARAMSIHLANSKTVAFEKLMLTKL